MTPAVEQMAKEYKASIQDLYGEDFVELIVFEFHEESHFDMAIVLRNSNIRTTEEIFRTSPIGAKLEVKYGLTFTTHPVSLKIKQTSMFPVHQVMREEGIVI